MTKNTRYLGLDVHAETITAAVAEGRQRIRNLGKFPNRPETVRKLIEKLGGGKNLKVCYEAGPTGYALYWQLAKLGVACVFPTTNLAICLHSRSAIHPSSNSPPNPLHDLLAVRLRARVGQPCSTSKWRWADI